MTLVTTGHRAGAPRVRNASAMRDRAPVTVTCKHGHTWETRARTGSSIRCPECRINTRIRMDPRDAFQIATERARDRYAAKTGQSAT